MEITQDQIIEESWHYGAPFLIGLAAGYFLKKLFKIMLFIGGFAISAYVGWHAYTKQAADLKVFIPATELIRDAFISLGDQVYARLEDISGRDISATAGFLAGLKLG